MASVGQIGSKLAIEAGRLGERLIGFDEKVEGKVERDHGMRPDRLQRVRIARASRGIRNLLVLTGQAAGQLLEHP